MTIDWKKFHNPKGISRKELAKIKAHAEALADAHLKARDAARREKTAEARKLAVDTSRAALEYLAKHFKAKDYNAQARIARQQWVRKANAEARRKRR